MVVLMGPPGSGKGTQGSLFSSELGFKHISTGDLLRSHIEQGTKIGKIAAEAQQSGAYLSDDLMIEIIRKEIGGAKRIVLDGFPRTLRQVKELAPYAASRQVCLLPVVLEMNDSELVERISGRLTHPFSGRVYHVKTAPPAVEGHDDVTGEPLVKRPDDEAHLIAHRLQLYRTGIQPVLDYYKTRHLCSVNASGSAKEVFENIQGHLDRAYAYMNEKSISEGRAPRGPFGL